MRNRVASVALFVIGFGSLGNGLWMLAAPMSWFRYLPADVPDFGPFNPHFVRDIGCAYLVVGMGLLWALRARASRAASLGALVVATAFHVAHALLHVYDMARDAVGPIHWLDDLPGVYLPAILLPWVISVRLRSAEAPSSLPVAWRRIAKIAAINGIAALALGEAASWAFASLRLHATYGSIALEKEQFLARVPRPRLDPDLKARLDAVPVPADNIPRELHPFFGYTYARHIDTRASASASKTNNFGFLEGVDYPYVRGPKELVVGVFGGSVALDLRLPAPRKAIEDAFRSTAQGKGYEKVTVLSFAQGGWRQPQTLFCLLYYLDTIDVALVLDGFNDVSPLPLGVEKPIEYPLDFPWEPVYRPLASSHLLYGDLLVEREIGQKRVRQIHLTQIAARGLFGRSMLVHMLWRSAMAVSERQVASLATQHSRGTDVFDHLYPEHAGIDQLTGEFFRRYEGFTETAYQVARSHHVPVLHFVQPNQYVPESKIYSEVELRLCLRQKEGQGRIVETYYPRLSAASADLRARGVPSYDLTMLFKDDPDTLYRDDCCHLLPEGMTLVAREMARLTLASGQIDRVPASDERTP